MGLVPSDPAVELLLRMGWWDVQHFPRTRAGAAVLTLSHCRMHCRNNPSCSLGWGLTLCVHLYTGEGGRLQERDQGGNPVREVCVGLGKGFAGDI